MKEIYLWEFVLSHLSKNRPVILVVVSDHKKGSPGKRGFKMAVTANDTSGSIGGGVMEFGYIKECRELLRKKSFKDRIETVYHNKKKDVKISGLICSGSQTNLIIRLRKKDAGCIKNIIIALKENSPGILKINSNGISFKFVKRKISESSFYYKDSNDWKFEQSTGIKNTVCIIGGGHVGMAVCRLMSMLDFYIILYDNRIGVATMNEINYSGKTIIGPYSEAGRIINAESYVIILTSGFDSDKEALIAVLKKNPIYTGLMGTKAKIRKIFSDLKKNGIKDETLAKVHAPVGLDINSDTPEEIAVSIAAEIIRKKNKGH